MKHDTNCVIWIKLDRNFLHNALFVGITYIAPDNLPVHAIYDEDIFQTIESDVNMYKDVGQVYLTGDMNSRIGRKCDFIENDRNIEQNDDTVTDQLVV